MSKKLCQKNILEFYIEFMTLSKKIYLSFFRIYDAVKKNILYFCIGLMTVGIFSSWQLCVYQLKCACLLLFSVVDSLSCVIVCCA